MVTTRAPAETGQTHRALPLTKHFDIDASAKEKTLTVRRERQRGTGTAHQTAPLEAVEQQHPEIAGEMVVADARLAHRGVGWPGLYWLYVDPRGQTDELLDCRANGVVSETMVAMPTRLLDSNELCVEQLREMRARGLLRDAGGARELRSGERAPFHQREQDVRARAIANQPRDRGDVGYGRCVLHSSMVVEP